MGTSFFTMLCQMEGASLVIAAVKENDNFLYPQKKVMSLLRCATQAEELATSPHSAKKIQTTSVLTPSSTPFNKHTPVAQVFG